MGKIIAFNFITLDGFYKGVDEDISWHRHGAEETLFSEEMLSFGYTLVFGRKTYEHMAAFWPTSDAATMFPQVAKGMNSAQKLVITHNPDYETPWGNTRVISNNVPEQFRELKRNTDLNMAILGSGSIVAQFAEEKLIDEFQIMIDPVAIGSGTPLFGGLQAPVSFELAGTRSFKSGTMLLYYHVKS